MVGELRQKIRPVKNRIIVNFKCNKEDTLGEGEELNICVW